MKLSYKVQQFWLRKGMWNWTFSAWLNLMYPHIYDKDEYDEYDESHNRFQFWFYLNNFLHRTSDD